MDKYNIYQNKLIKYKCKHTQNTNPIYNQKIKFYEILCTNLRHDMLLKLKFYHGILDFLDMNIIKYISEFSKVSDGNYQDIFTNINTQLNVPKLNVKYNPNDKDFKPENTHIIIEQLSATHFWSNVLSNIILWKILYLYEFNEKVGPKIKDYCQSSIESILKIYN